MQTVIVFLHVHISALQTFKLDLLSFGLYMNGINLQVFKIVDSSFCRKLQNTLNRPQNEGRKAEQMLYFREASECCISGHLAELEVCQSNATVLQEWYHTWIVSCGNWGLPPWKDHSKQTLFASHNEGRRLFLGVKHSFKIPDVNCGLAGRMLPSTKIF